MLGQGSTAPVRRSPVFPLFSRSFKRTLLCNLFLVIRFDLLRKGHNVLVRVRRPIT